MAERLGRRTLKPELLQDSPEFNYMYTAMLVIYPGNLSASLISAWISAMLGHFLFVRADRPDRSVRKRNVPSFIIVLPLSSTLRVPFSE